MRGRGETEEVLDRVLKVDEGAYGIDASSGLLIEETGWNSVSATAEEAHIVGIHSQIVDGGYRLEIAGRPFGRVMCLGEERQQGAEREGHRD